MQKKQPARIKPEYLPISEEEAKKLLASGKAKKLSQIQDRIFTLAVTLGAFLIITGSFIVYFSFIDEPLLIDLPAKNQISLAFMDPASPAFDIIRGYNENLSDERLEEVFESVRHHAKAADVFVLQDIFEQLMARRRFKRAREMSSRIESLVQPGTEAFYRFFWLKAQLAYFEKNYEESRYHLMSITRSANPFQERAAKLDREIDEMLNGSIWEDW